VLFLFVAPIAGSAGARATCLIVATLAIILSGIWRDALKAAPRAAPGIVLAWFFLATLSIAWSVDRDLTLGELRAEALYGALSFAVFYVLATDARRWRAWWIALIAGAAFTYAANKFQQFTGIAVWHNPPDGGVGAFSTYLVIAAPLFIALAWNGALGMRRGAWTLALSLVALFVAAWTTSEPWTTPNRIVWVALGAVLLAALVAGRKAAGGPRESIPALRRIVAVAGLAIAAGFVASIAVKSERFYRDDPSLAASVEHDLRPRLWALALERWKDAPFIGHGFGREILAADFLPLTPKGVQHPPLTHGHNVLLNIGMQLGLLGAAAAIALVIILVREYVAMLPRSSTALLGVIGLALLAGFLVKNATDDFMHRHNAQVFWALNGMLLGLAARARRRD
jgi:O-antigen ligase